MIASFAVLILAAVVGFLVFSPTFKGFRTQIAGYIVVFGGGALPFLTEATGYLQTLDWRQYVLDGDKKSYYVLGVTAGLGVLMIILRHMTTTPVGTKE